MYTAWSGSRAPSRGRTSDMHTLNILTSLKTFITTGTHQECRPCRIAKLRFAPCCATLTCPPSLNVLPLRWADLFDLTINTGIVVLCLLFSLESMPSKKMLNYDWRTIETSEQPDVQLLSLMGARKFVLNFRVPLKSDAWMVKKYCVHTCSDIQCDTSKLNLLLGGVAELQCNVLSRTFYRRKLSWCIVVCLIDFSCGWTGLDNQEGR